jgi:hypothetical protein
MSSKTFLISDFNIGLEKDKEPFLLPEKAFPVLEDAYVFRGRVKRRFGFNLFEEGQLGSRLRMDLGNTGVSPFGATVPGAVPIPSPGRQIFSIGTVILTSNNSGAGVQPLISTDPTYSGTFNNTTGVVSIVHPVIGATAVFYYPGLPVMGLPTRETETVNFEQTVAFDTQFAYQRSGTGWDILGPLPPGAGSSLWTGTNSQFHWITNYRSANAYENNFYVVNGVAADNIRYITAGTSTWVNLRPQLNGAGTIFLETAKIIIPFKDRLIALNTIEEDATATDRTHENRARWSQNGDPTVAATSWLDDTVGRGGFIDAPISEAIVSAQFVQNRLIVFFERSTWELLYTGNEILPFVWQRINTELGCESTFSQVGFDEGIVGIGNRGIHFANTNGVKRIDEKIPDIISEINNLTQGAERVYGIRDFSREIIMWSFTQFSATGTFPNRNLLYNYRNNTFANFNNYFTCFGYFQKSSGLTWATLPYADWIEWIEPWNAGISQARFPLIISGNQQGFTHLFESNNNDFSLMVTDVNGGTLTLTVPDHNLLDGQFIRLSNMNGLTITPASPLIFKIDNVTVNTFTIDATTIAGTYTGGGLVEVLNNFDIRTKNFPFFSAQGFDTLLNDVEILLDKTSDGECTFNIFQDFNTTEVMQPLFGNSTLNTKPEDADTFANSQNKIWHIVPRQVIADSFQFQFTLSDDQMRNEDIQASDFVLHALLIDVEPTGRIK